MGFGIVIVAVNHQLYGTYALNLAMSLKLYDPGAKVALLCDSEAVSHLTADEKKFFDQFIYIPEEDYTVNGKRQPMRIKLMINRYTPFEHTLYLDADNLWFDKKASWLFGELFGRSFCIGYNTQFDVKKQRTGKLGYTYWSRDENEMAKYHKIPNVIPQTVSGFFYFKSCHKTDQIFEEALKVFDDPKAPCEVFAESRPDEYCFNVALGKLDYTQEEFNPLYFDRIHGAKEREEIYHNYWGMAIGGNRVSKPMVALYNQLVQRNCILAGTEPRLHADKFKIIPERFKN